MGNLDVRKKGILIEQNRTPSKVSRGSDSSGTRARGIQLILAG